MKFIYDTIYKIQCPTFLKTIYPISFYFTHSHEKYFETLATHLFQTLNPKYCLRPSNVINQENCYPLDAELYSNSNIDYVNESTAEIQQSSKTETDSGKVLSIYH